MLERNTALPNLNFLWVGPPRNDPVGLGSDVKDVIEMAKVSPNPIRFFCLGESKEYYENLFDQHAPGAIKVESIDAYLAEKQKFGDPEISQHAKKMQAMRNELLKEPRNRIIDKVSFKDAFSLFLLASEGGYTLDTNIKLKEGSTNVEFPAHEEFKAPHTEGESKEEPIVECWMMYASPSSLDAPRKMLGNYLSEWDEAQKIIRGNQKNISNVHKYHNRITDLMIDSITDGLKTIPDDKRFDERWHFSVRSVEGPGIKAIGTLDSNDALPLVKGYGNTHKPEYECKQIVCDSVHNLVNEDTKINRDARVAAVNSFIAKLGDYTKITDLQRISVLNGKIDLLVKSLKEMDKYALQLTSVSNQYRSGSNDPQKMRFANQIDAAINDAYQQLSDIAKTGRVAGRVKFSHDVINEFKETVQKISGEAKAYHKKKHPLFRGETRFVSETQLETTPPIRGQKSK